MKPSHIAAGGLALLLAATPWLGILPGWTPSLATTTAFTALALIGLNIIFGVTGMLAFGQAAVMTVPAYAAGVLVHLGLSPVLALLGGLLVGVAVVRLMAEIFVRLPGVFLAVGTLGFGFVVEGLARAFPGWTGGASGLVFAAGRGISPQAWYGIALVSLAGGVALYAATMRGARWRRLRTIRHDELVAASMGIDVVRAKVRAFTLGSGCAVLAGMLLAWYVGVVVPENAGVERSLEQIGMVMLGGPALPAGPVIGAFIVSWLFFAAGYAERFELLIYGVVFLAAVIYAREGVAGWLRGPWARLAARLDGPAAPPPAPVPFTRGHAAPTEFCLEVEGVGRRFGGVQALDGVSFTVAPGEIFTLVGPNGAGKSTLFNLISGLMPPTSGVIRVAGQDMASLPVHRRAALIGRSFQVARLVPDLTAAENVMLRLDNLSDAPRDEEARIAAARAQLDAFGLLHLADRQVGALSVGQHKLIDLARAAIGSPPLVLLDEPAVGLAADELEHLEHLLRQLSALGSAVVIVEHNIAFVARIATRGLVLDSGKPVALGRVADILADPRVHEAYFGALT